MKTSLLLSLLLGSTLVGCAGQSSAPLPEEGDCISDLSSNYGPIVEPAGQKLTGYRVVGCDSDEAEFQVMVIPLGRSGPGPPSPDPCASSSRMVYIMSEGELYMFARPICLVPAP